MANVTPALRTALAEGATAITPNRRLARHLQREFDRVQQAEGRPSWPTPSILPYAAWLESLWQQAVAADMNASSTLLMTASQSALLWRRVIDATPAPLLDPDGAAALAAEAWSLVHAWGAGGESWRAWRRDSADEADDPALFAAWAEAYLAELRGAEAIDPAQLADVLTGHGWRLGGGRLRAVFAGFVELTPQQQRLVAALTAAGADIRSLDSLPERSGTASRTAATTPRDELRAALAWARERAFAQPQQAIGVVIDDLAQRRDEIIAQAEDILCPERVLPELASTRRPFEVSLGMPLASVPLVIAALDLIVLGETRLTCADAAALLRSPYLAGADTAQAPRAAIERDWLDDGRREVALADAIAALEQRSPDLAQLWRHGRLALATGPIASPREWADAWRAWLAAAGWPGSRPLDSAEHQAREAWEDLLAHFVRLGAVAARLGQVTAVQTLRALARGRVFQPEGSSAPIQLLGVLEASGLTFDALWVTGLSADRWPPTPSPNPLLPLAWQRQRGAPRASAARELAFAKLLTERFVQAAPEVVFSCAQSVDDHPLSPSALILGYPELATPSRPASWASDMARSAQLEAIVDDRAPPLAAGSRAPGGSGIVAAQSDCPFQAVARHRLGAQPWPTAPAGLSSAERGLIVHAALATLWKTLGDRATLAALDPGTMAVRIDVAIEQGLAQLRPRRRRNLPAIVRESETQRLAALLRAWIDVELDRPSFTVRAIETATTIELARIAFRLRLDRVDALTDGGVAIIDYKTGRVERPKQWFDERPRTPQLGLYVLAQRQAWPEIAVRAVAYAQLKADAIEAVGLAADPAAWPGFTKLSATGRFEHWGELEAWWRDRLGELGREIAAGCASVTPRERPLPCRTCGLQPLCRIESVPLAGDDGDADA